MIIRVRSLKINQVDPRLCVPGGAVMFKCTTVAVKTFIVNYNAWWCVKQSFTIYKCNMAVRIVGLNLFYFILCEIIIVWFLFYFCSVDFDLILEWRASEYSFSVNYISRYLFDYSVIQWGWLPFSFIIVHLVNSLVFPSLFSSVLG